MNIKEKILQFWRSDNEKISLLRDILVALMAVLIVLLILWTYTGQWFAAPMVAIESGSMEHDNSPFGRLGTIDAGDMVLVQKVYTKSDLITHGGNFGGAKEKEDPSNFFYGDWGDVVIYKPLGRDDVSQIIHRAICWIEYNDDNTYSIKEYGIENVDSITINELGLNNYRPSHSGFITQGDNPLTNDRCDQSGGICSEPIKLEWISGKARCELPWIGTINLLFNDFVSGSFWDQRQEITVYNVPIDSIYCLIILVIVLISIPISMDVYDYYKIKNKMRCHPYG